MLPELMGHSIWWEPKPLTGLLGLGVLKLQSEAQLQEMQPKPGMGEEKPFLSSFLPLFQGL